MGRRSLFVCAGLVSLLVTAQACARPIFQAREIDAASPRNEAWKPHADAPRTERRVDARTEPRAESRSAVVDAARQIAATSSPRDCSSFVIAAYARAGQPLHAEAAKGGSIAEGLYQSLARDKRTFRDAPAPGDLAFFRDTFGTPRGRVTHVSIVERVEADGTVVLLDRLNTGVKESRCCLRAPHDPARNSWLRRARGKEPSLAGELFVAFGRP